MSALPPSSLAPPQLATPSLGITWQQPTFLLPLFCLCSLLGSTQSLAAAIGMSAVIIIATVLYSLITVLLARLMPSLVSPALWLICAAVLITLMELLLHASHYALYIKLGLFLPMGVIACLLLARMEMLREQRGLMDVLKRAGLMSGGYALAAMVLGAGRELVGHGSLFSDAGVLLGEWARPLEWQVFRVDMGFLLGILAPGAFVGLGLGVALYNWLWLRLRGGADE